MKRLRISKLMDEYTDTEFFPAGGSAADPEAVKGWVLANAKPAKQKKQLPKKRKVLIAAALAAVLVILVGAGYPYIQHSLVSGALIFQQTGDERITAFVHYGSPVVKVEDDRVLFKQDGDEYLDITGLISEDTPYLYDGSDPDTGSTYYVIIGGTLENCGYLEWITAPSPFDDEDEAGSETAYSFEWVTSELEPGPLSFGAVTGFYMPVQLEDEITPPWLLTGLNELGIPYEYAPPENLG